MGKFRKTVQNNTGTRMNTNNKNCLCYYGWEPCCDSNSLNTSNQGTYSLLEDVEAIAMSGKKVSKSYINRMIGILSQNGIDINNRTQISMAFNQLSPSDISQIENRTIRLNSMSVNTAKNKLLVNAGNNTGGNNQVMWFLIWLFLFIITCADPDNECFSQ